MSEFETRLACLISANGDIGGGYMIDKRKFDGTNKYTISRQIPLRGNAKTNFAATIGSALDGRGDNFHHGSPTPDPRGLPKGWRTRDKTEHGLRLRSENRIGQTRRM